jgi:ribonuclease P protein component
LNTQNTLSVFERIKSKKYFELLFSKEAKVIHEKNILAKWAIIPKDDACLAKVAFVVPKRICKKATERNYFKRILKESYRTSKHNLIEASADLNHTVLILFLYKNILDSKKEAFQIMDVQVKSILQKIEKKQLK